MSTSQHLGGTDPRVRDRARGALAVMLFSATTSGGLAGALVLVVQLGR